VEPGFIRCVMVCVFEDVAQNSLDCVTQLLCVYSWIKSEPMGCARANWSQNFDDIDATEWLLGAVSRRHTEKAKYMLHTLVETSKCFCR
jgi:hypothetical protein